MINKAPIQKARESLIKASFFCYKRGKDPLSQENQSGRKAGSMIFTHTTTISKYFPQQKINTGDSML